MPAAKHRAFSNQGRTFVNAAGQIRVLGASSMNKCFRFAMAEERAPGNSENEEALGNRPIAPETVRFRGWHAD